MTFSVDEPVNESGLNLEREETAIAGEPLEFEEPSSNATLLGEEDRFVENIVQNIMLAVDQLFEYVF